MNNTSVKEKYILDGLNCAGCTKKIEVSLSENNKYISEASINFTTKKLIVVSHLEDEKELQKEIQKVVDFYESGVTVRNVKEEKVDNKAEEKRKKALFFTGIIFFIMATLVKQNIFAIENSEVISIVIYAIAYLLVGGDVVRDAIADIFKGNLFDEKFLMTIATFSAWGIGEYPEAVAVMLFYKAGEMFENYAVNKSRDSIEGLLDIKVSTTNVVNENGYDVVDTDFVKIGSIILVKPGEKVPLDGEIIEGDSSVDTSAITGESVPVRVNVGEKIYSGSINGSGVLKVKTTSNFEDSMIGKIMEMIENSSTKKAKTEKFITKFAKVYTPIVVFAAVLLAVIPPLVTGAPFGEWLYRASIFLVVSCPCALVISVPLGYFSGIGKASKNGILIKGGNYLEALKNIDTVLLDKTGTITQGEFSVENIYSSDKGSEGNVLEVAAKLEGFSNHPIARSIVNEYTKQTGKVISIENREIINSFGFVQGNQLSNSVVTNFEDIAGKGIQGEINGVKHFVGNKKMMEFGKIEENKEMLRGHEADGTIVHVASEKKYIGFIVITDMVKETSKAAISELKKVGVKRTVMVTGDKDEIGRKVASSVGITEAFTELLPDEKVKKLEEVKKSGAKVIFVGDGLNDAPALALADVGVAMGKLGADLTIEAADMVIMNDSLEKISDAIRIAKFTDKIIIQNIVFALAVKLAVIILGAIGVATMWAAVFADVGVALIAILNSMRIK